MSLSHVSAETEPLLQSGAAAVQGEAAERTQAWAKGHSWFPFRVPGSNRLSDEMRFEEDVGGKVG